MFFLRFQAIIQKGGGTGPEKPWQPSLHNDRCQFHPGANTGNDDGMYASLRVHTSLQIFFCSPLLILSAVAHSGSDSTTHKVAFEQVWQNDIKRMRAYTEFISEKTRYFDVSESFTTELGGLLPSLRIAYRTWGRLNARKDNVILVCQALTGSADADAWWEGMFSGGGAFDDSADFIICTNVLGSCYGTTGPVSINPLIGRNYGPDFSADNHQGYGACAASPACWTWY